ncbi:MAG TPA: GspE/PulE family protein [Fimbriimonadaceae bacterium]|nr:GspE/PulE family protein [Fimbriimonadaceae bacterium]
MNLDKSLADIFIEEGYVSASQLDEILAHRSDTTEPLGDLLVRMAIISDKQRLKCVGLQSGLPFVDLANFEIDFEAASLISQQVAMRLHALPVEVTELSASVAMKNPLDVTAIDELAELMGRDIDPMWAAPDDLREAITRVFGAYDDLDDVVAEAAKGMDADVQIEAKQDDDDVVNVIELREQVEGAPIIKMANAIINKAVKVRASDIHIEPLQHGVRVRFRIDGLLQEIMTVSKDYQRPLISRIKIVAGLDIAERRVPQDGRCTMMSPQGEFDFRVSTYPSVFGEKVVIRLLDKSSVRIDLEKLGMTDGVVSLLKHKIDEPQGLILVTGPTGSGKTTTLYAALNHLNGIHRNIVTIEDPVEYQLPGITQANINPLAGVTFAAGLRSILRQDPDIILVGEVRDTETASIAIESALTGHLVLTSLHSNDSAAALTRLTDMGVEPFLVGASITASLAQRLLRVNCVNCSQPYTPDAQVLQRLGMPLDHTYIHGVGCDLCTKTGFRGRMGIYELLDVTPDIRKMILAGNNATEIRDHACESGMKTLRQDAIGRVLAGKTTVEEVVRVTSDGQ